MNEKAKNESRSASRASRSGKADAVLRILKELLALDLPDGLAVSVNFSIAASAPIVTGGPRPKSGGNKSAPLIGGGSRPSSGGK